MAGVLGVLWSTPWASAVSLDQNRQGSPQPSLRIALGLFTAGHDRDGLFYRRGKPCETQLEKRWPNMDEFERSCKNVGEAPPSKITSQAECLPTDANPRHDGVDGPPLPACQAHPRQPIPPLCPLTYTWMDGLVSGCRVLCFAAVGLQHLDPWSEGGWLVQASNYN